MNLLRPLGLAACVILGAMVTIAPSAWADGCFTRLTDKKSRDTANFSDLATNTTATAGDEVKFLPLVTGEKGQFVNIDFYYITFKRPTNQGMEDLFKTIRTDFNSIIVGQSTDFGFGPYKSSADDGATNKRIWESGNPLNAVMSFNLDTLWPGTWKSRLVDNRAGRYLVGKAGDLQVTCATKTDFVFSTVESENGGPHPVSGNRGFGLADNGDGTWTFYSKAVDRVTTSWNLKILFASKTFCKGHGFWTNIFYPGMKRYFESKKPSLLVKEIWTENHGPVPFPFGRNEEAGDAKQLASMKCD